ncbi:MAG: transposase [Myxococcota bacterium]
MPTDLRNGYGGLYDIVRHEFARDPMSGDAFLFSNKRRKSAKVKLWDNTGLCIFSKRLSAGTNSCFWGTPGNPLSTMTTSESALLLDGLTHPLCPGGPRRLSTLHRSQLQFRVGNYVS